MAVERFGNEYESFIKKYLEELKADWDNADDPIMKQDKKKGQYKKFLQKKLNKQWSK